MIRFSAIIPSYNSHKTVMQTIDSLLCQPSAALPEIIIVDSSEDEHTMPLLKPCCSERIKLVHLDKKTIPAVGRNIGAKMASGEVLLFVDSDATVAEDWCERVERAYQQGCRVGGGAVLLPEWQKKVPLAVAQYFLQFNEFMEEGARRIVDFSPSCNLFCEKALFERVGGFPEIRASEDVLFGFKVNRDTPYYFDPNIRVYHIFSTDPARYHSNQRMLGAYVLIDRRSREKKWFYYGPWPLLFLPLFLAVKMKRISLRVLRSGAAWKRRAFFATLPLFLAGLCSWAQGFASAACSKSGEWK